MTRSIVVGTDGSETATSAVRAAAELARALGARVNVVSAYEPLTGVQVKGAEAPADLEATVAPDAGVLAILEDAQGVVRSVRADCETHARREDPAEAILNVAEEQGADRIVVGNKGMTGARSFLLGSVPDKISHHASCDVLIVRTA